jgi:hypothetical protein
MGLGRLKFALAVGLLAGLAAQPAFPAWQAGKPAPSTTGSSATGSSSGTSAPKGQSASGDKNYAGRQKPDGAKGQNDGRGMAGLPPKWIDNLRDMSPEEQERFMRNNRRFQNLPPQRQTQIRRTLENWNRLSPTERSAIRDRERVWEQMSPEQRAYVKNVLLPKWQAMPPDRRNLIKGRLHVLQGMTTAQQQEAMKDPRFLQGLSPDEQQMLREVNSLRNAPLP